MKKFFIALFCALYLVSPTLTFAVSADDTEIDIKKYETKNLHETLAEEEIKEAFTKYEEKDDQINIYLFRGHGCHYCQNFLNFLNSITQEYGKYFKLVSFEVWSNQENSSLMGEVSKFIGTEDGGVPYIIIGDQVFPGYAEDYDEGIKSAIKTLYDSDERYDVFEEYNKAVKAAKKAAKGDTGTIVFWNAFFTVAAVLCVVLYNKKQNKVLLDKIDELSKKSNKEVEVKSQEKKSTNVKKRK